MTRRLLGLATIIIGIFLCYRSGSAMSAYASRSGDWSLVYTDPVFVLPFLVAIFVAFGGLLGLIAMRGSAIFTGIAVALYGLFIGAIVASGGDQSLWRFEAYVTSVLFVLTLLFILVPRRR